MTCYNYGFGSENRSEHNPVVNSFRSTLVHETSLGGGATKKTRKAPKEFAKNCRVGIIKKGIDGSDWKVYKRKNGIKSWKRV